jgi:predicted N-acetyltransferase YhbS
VDITIRKLQRSEIEVAQRVLDLCFGEKAGATAASDLVATFADYPYRPNSLVAIRGGNIVGFIQSCTAYFHPATQGLLWLGVLPEHRNRGIAAALISSAENAIRLEKFGEAGGTIILVAEHRKEYYERLGYREAAAMHDRYPLMIKYIKPGGAKAL